MQPIFYSQAAQLFARTFHVNAPHSAPSQDPSFLQFFSSVEKSASFADGCERLFSLKKYSVPFSSELLRSCFVTALIQQFHKEKALVNSRTEAAQGLDQAAKKKHCDDVAQLVMSIAIDKFKNRQLKPLCLENINTEVNKTLNEIYLTEARRITRQLVRNNTPDVKTELEARHFDPHHPSIQAILEEPRAAVAPPGPTALDHLEELIRKKWQHYAQNPNAAVESRSPSFSTECINVLNRSSSNCLLPFTSFTNKYIEVAVQILVASNRVAVETPTPGLTARYRFPNDDELLNIIKKIPNNFKIDCPEIKINCDQLLEKINEQLDLEYITEIKHNIALILHNYPFRDTPQPVLSFVQWAITYLKERYPRSNTWIPREKEVIKLLIMEYAPYRASKEFLEKIKDTTSKFADYSDEVKCHRITSLITGENRAPSSSFILNIKEALDSPQLKEKIKSRLKTQISLLASYENNEPFARFKIIEAQKKEMNDLLEGFAREKHFLDSLLALTEE